MLKSILSLFIAVIIANAAFAANKMPSYNMRSGTTNIKVSASIIDINTDINKIVLRDNARITAVDTASNTSFEVDAKKMIITLFSSKTGAGSAAGTMAIKYAEMSGPVKLTHVSVNPQTGTKMTSTATADSATFNGVDQIAILNGNVKVISNNPAIFDEPAVMTGDKVTVNLAPVLGPDDFRFRIESSPEPSRIEVTPKKQEPKSK